MDIRRKIKHLKNSFTCYFYISVLKKSQPWVATFVVDLPKVDLIFAFMYKKFLLMELAWISKPISVSITDSGVKNWRDLMRNPRTNNGKYKTRERRTLVKYWPGPGILAIGSRFARCFLNCRMHSFRWYMPGKTVRGGVGCIRIGWWLMFSRGWCIGRWSKSFQVEVNVDVTRIPDLWSIHRSFLMPDVATDSRYVLDFQFKKKTRYCFLE